MKIYSGQDVFLVLNADSMQIFYKYWKICFMLFVLQSSKHLRNPYNLHSIFELLNLFNLIKQKIYFYCVWRWKANISTARKSWGCLLKFQSHVFSKIHSRMMWTNWNLDHLIMEEKREWDNNRLWCVFVYFIFPASRDIWSVVRRFKWKTKEN